MASTQLETALRRLRTVLIPRAAGTDADLIRQFTDHRDQNAFVAIVQRHGNLVLNVCRHVLSHEADAEDAFQATFLVLARKGASLKAGIPLGCWLHKVAFHCARNLRKTAMRRRKHEEAAPAVRQVGCPASDATLHELQGWLDEEIECLAETYRMPFILCHLQGKSRAEAAQILGWKEGTLSSRLAKARATLQKRLLARGVALSAILGSMAIVPTAAAVSTKLAHRTLEAALAFVSGNTAGAVSAQALTAANGVLKTILVAKVKLIGTILFVASFVAFAAAGLVAKPEASDQAASKPAAKNSPEIVVGPEAKKAVDSYGDPLPDGAIARFGTMRLRHSFWVTGVSFSADGKLLASSGWDGAVRLWDADTGKETQSMVVKRPPGLSPETAFLGVATSNGQVIAMENGDTLHSWDIKSGKKLFELKGRYGFGLAISKDGRMLAKGLSGEGGFGQVELWDLEHRKMIRSLGATKRTVQALAFSPDGSLVAFGEYEDDDEGEKRKPQISRIHLFDPVNGIAIRQLDGHQRSITSLAFAPDGATLVSAGCDATMRIWDVKTGRLIRAVKVPDNSWGEKGVNSAGVRSVAFSSDGRILASGGEDGDVRIWNPATGAELHILRGHDGRVTSLTFSSDNKQLASGSFDQTIRIWDTATGKENRPREGSGGVLPLFVSPDGRLLASTSWDRKVRLWSLVTRRQLHLMEGHTEMVRTLGFSADSRHLASAGDDGTIRLWDTSTGREVRKLNVGNTSVYSVSFFPDGKTLAFGGKDATLRLWDWSHGKESRRITLETGVSYFDVSRDGRLLFGDSRHPTLWDSETGTIRREWKEQTTGTALSRDESSCWTQDSEGALHKWSVETGEELRSVNVPKAATRFAGVPNLVLSPDCRLLAHSTGFRRGNDQTTPVTETVETATGVVRRRFTGHQGAVGGQAFSANGRELYTGSRDTTILAWDLTRRDEKRPDRLGDADLAALWNDLGTNDGERADRAIRTLVARPIDSIPFLKNKLRPSAPIAPSEISSLLADLESKSFTTREKAHAELEKMDEQARAALKDAIKNPSSLEGKRRTEAILAKLRGPIVAPEVLKAYRAIEVLESIGDADATGLLRNLANGATDARQTQEAQAALRRIERR